MTNVSARPNAAESFRKWQAFLDGNPGSATSLVDSARLIDNFCDSNPTELNPTAGGPTDPEPLPVIPGYTILDRLGRGGMGEVFRVRDALDREHALKVARRGQLSVAGRERFRAEAHAMARLDHSNVVRVGHYGDIGGQPYFEMPLYPANLADRLGDYGDVRAAVRLMARVADGVGHLHARGFVHRDLKPTNILLTADGRPAVSDFGLIKGPADSDPGPAEISVGGSAETNATGARRSHTVAGVILGTRRYMAPDQAAGHNHRAGPAWDVWALGVMLHELLTGQTPRSSDAPERLLNPIEPDNPPPTRVKPDLDPRLGRIIEKCLAREPGERYPNGAAVAADLKGWLRRGSRKWMRIVGAGLLVLLVAGTITAAMNWPRRPTNPPAPQNEREQILADVQQQLRDGKTVELIGEIGMPQWFDVVASGGSKPFVSDMDGTMCVNDTEVTLIDLPPTGLDRYRFEVEVRELGHAPAPAEFGAYVGRHRRKSTAGEDIECFAALWFNEKMQSQDHPVGPPRMWAYGMRSLKDIPGRVPGLGIRSFDQGPNLAQPLPPGNRWHTFAVEVRPNQMAWWFDGEAAQVIPLPVPPKYADDFAANAMLLPDPNAAVSPAGGYGIYISQGSAAVRNARVTRIDP